MAWPGSSYAGSCVGAGCIFLSGEALLRGWGGVEIISGTKGYCGSVFGNTLLVQLQRQQLFGAQHLLMALCACWLPVARHAHEHRLGGNGVAAARTQYSPCAVHAAGWANIAIRQLSAQSPPPPSLPSAFCFWCQVVICCVSGTPLCIIILHNIPLRSVSPPPPLPAFCFR